MAFINTSGQKKTVNQPAFRKYYSQLGSGYQKNLIQIIVCTFSTTNIHLFWPILSTIWFFVYAMSTLCVCVKNILSILAAH